MERKAREWGSGEAAPRDIAAGDRPAGEIDAPDAQARAAAEQPVLGALRTQLEREGWTPDLLVEAACAAVGGDPAGVRSGAGTRADQAARSVIAFVACDVAGWTMRETAASVGVGPTALGYARRRGRARLAEMGLDPADLLALSREAVTVAKRRL